jgi:hypothetical protein
VETRKGAEGDYPTDPRFVAAHGQATDRDVNQRTAREFVVPLARHTTVGLLQRDERLIRVAAWLLPKRSAEVGPAHGHSVRDGADTRSQRDVVQLFRGRDGALGTAQSECRHNDNGNALQHACLLVGELISDARCRTAYRRSRELTLLKCQLPGIDQKACTWFR